MIIKAALLDEAVTTDSRRLPYATLFALSALLVLATGCALVASRDGIPSSVQAAIDAVGRDIADTNYEKVYKEAAKEWRQARTSEQSTAILGTLRDKLGAVKSRSLHSATEQRNTGGQLPGHVFIIAYQTTFERGEGMETYTLVERDGNWLLARYFVNSDALK